MRTSFSTIIISLSQFWLESVYWAAVLSLALYGLGSDLMTHLQGFVGDQIDTGISLRPSQDVPFPMVVINSGGPIDPLGFVRATKNLAVEKDVPRKGELSGLNYREGCIFLIQSSIFVLCSEKDATLWP